MSPIDRWSAIWHENINESPRPLISLEHVSALFRAIKTSKLASLVRKNVKHACGQSFGFTIASGRKLTSSKRQNLRNVPPRRLSGKMTSVVPTSAKADSFLQRAREGY
ncbi:MAG: hypothetical protein ACTS6A_01270 [Candidatus Hodgkinia cicadicola]